MSNCSLPPTCGMCICNPLMCAVGVGAATGSVGTPVCGSVASCCGGMPAVTVTGQAKSILPWVLGGALALYLLMRKKR
jgi:hypothetical protein